jgi:NinB protein
MRKFLITGPIAREAIRRCLEQAEEGSMVVFRESDRTLEQNAAQWPVLEAFAQQRQWPINGKMEWLTAEDWKDVLTAGFREYRPRVAAGINGQSMVMLGMRTSKFSKRDFSDWLDYLNAMAVELGVELRNV